MIVVINRRKYLEYFIGFALGVASSLIGGKQCDLLTDDCNMIPEVFKGK